MTGHNETAVFSKAGRREIRERFLLVDTSNVADVLDQMGLPDQGLAAEFLPFPAACGKLAGWAYTIRGQMVPYDGTGAAAGICYFGELIALGRKERGCVGSLVDGGIRDVRWIGEHNFPVYARYR